MVLERRTGRDSVKVGGGRGFSGLETGSGGGGVVVVVAGSSDS